MYYASLQAPPSINEQAEVGEEEESLSPTACERHLKSALFIIFPVPQWGRNTQGGNLFRLKEQ